MSDLVRLEGNRIEVPRRHLQFPLSPPMARLREGLEAYQSLKQDPGLQFLPLSGRREITGFLRRYGALLFGTLFPEGAAGLVSGNGPLLLELDADWAEYPWELLHDGTEWIALRNGVVRHAFPPEAGEPRGRPTGRLLRVLGVTANPLPVDETSPLGRQVRGLGTGFLSCWQHLAEPGGEREAPVQFRLLDHADLPGLEASLSLNPELLLFSGFAGEEGWHLECERFTGQLARWDWLLARIREASAEGLALMVLNDSLGLSQPRSAFARTRDLLRAGVPAVIRIEGRQAGLREREYLRTLARQLGQGSSFAQSHLAAVRRLFRRCEEGWDWSFMRLYQRALPARGDFVLPGPGADSAGDAPLWSGGAGRPDSGRDSRTFASPPVPPRFCGQRRFQGRGAVLRRLGEALQPDPEASSPLVYLSGRAGSGKTMLALESARRLRRRFAQVLYLHDRALPANPADDPTAGGQDFTAPPAGQPLFAALARHLQARPADNGAVEGWRKALLAHFGDGRQRLLILDRLERQPGYDALCETLLRLPRGCRVLLVSRARPPLLPGAALELLPLDDRELDRLFGAQLRERLVAHPEGEALLRHCRGDLLAARLLRGMKDWPDPSRLRSALAPSTRAGEDDEPAPAADARLPALLVDHALPRLGDDELALLRVLGLFPSLAHREILAQVSGLEAGRLLDVLAGLRRLGWVDAWHHDHYFALHPRLQRPVCECTLSRGFLAAQRPLLTRAYQTYLARLGAALDEDDPVRRRHPPPLLAWDDERCRSQPAERVRLLHRLGCERVNLAELALMLTEEGDWGNLQRLAEQAALLARLAECEDVWALLNRCLLAGGEALQDAVLQAKALNRLAEPLLTPQRAQKARPLLERSLELLGPTAGWAVMGETYLLLSRCYELLGRPHPALNLLYAAVELAQQTGHTAHLVRADRALIRIWLRRGEERAVVERFFRRQTHYLVRIGESLQAAVVTRLLAEYLLGAGRTDEAQALFGEVMERCRTLGSERETAAALLGLAECHAVRGDAEQALAVFDRAAGSGQARASSPEQQWRVLSEICRLFERNEQPQRALQGYLHLRGLLDELGEREALIGVLDRIGGLYFQLGEPGKSTRCYEERLHLQTALTPS